MLPFFNGERTPNRPNARGCLLGLTAANADGGHMLRATMEGATFGLKFGLEQLRNLGIESEEIILTGGGSRSAVWRQMVADVCQLPVILLQQEEGASFGAALQSLWVLQRQQNPNLTIEEISATHLSRDTSRSTQPNANHALTYARSYQQYQRALAQVTPLFNT